MIVAENILGNNIVKQFCSVVLWENEMSDYFKFGLLNIAVGLSRFKYCESNFFLTSHKIEIEIYYLF